MSENSSQPASGTTRPPLHDIRTLRRSSDDRVIAGVCGGLGRHAGIDPVIFRISLAVLAIFGGVGVLLYGLAWLLVPDDSATESQAQRLLRGRSAGGAVAVLVALALVVIAGGAALTDIGRFGWPGPLAIVLIVGALAALVVTQRGWALNDAADAADTIGTAPDPYSPLGPPPGYAPPPAASPAAPAPPVVPARKEPSVLAPVALSLSVVIVGVLLALSAAGAIDITAQGLFAAVVLTLGLALVLGTWVGRGRGLIVIGAILTVFLMIAASLNVPLRGGIGARLDQPTSLSQLQSSYHVGLGREELDLTQLPLDGATRHIEVRVGVGQLRVEVPSSAKVVVHASAGAGHLSIDGLTADGNHASRDVTLRATGPQTGEIDLDLHVGVGVVELERFAQPQGFAQPQSLAQPQGGRP